MLGDARFIDNKSLKIAWETHKPSWKKNQQYIVNNKAFGRCSFFKQAIAKKFIPTITIRFNQVSLG